MRSPVTSSAKVPRDTNCDPTEGDQAQRSNPLVFLLCRQVSRLLHAWWKSRDTGPSPDSAASLSNMQLTVRRRNTRSQASGRLLRLTADRASLNVGPEQVYCQLGLRRFLQYLPTKVESLRPVRSQPRPSMLSPNHCPLTILPFDAI